MTTHAIKPFTRAWGGWLGVVGVIAGLWLIAAPFVLNFNSGSAPGMNAIITGAVIAILSGLSAFGVGRLSTNVLRAFGWLTALAGVWAVISPFFFGYDQASAPFYVLVVTGVITALVAGYAAIKAPWTHS